jgi:GT2 family glycosyltransferase
MPSFSIVVAVYNSAGTVGEALDSAVAQTVAPCEVIVCDDGSTDDLDAALAPYRDRIVLLRRENGGEAAAKNDAIAAARGDFAVILDADDVFLPRRLERLGELAAERPDLDVLTTDAVLEADGREVGRCYDASWTFETADQRGAILERNFVFGLAAVRRARFAATGGFDPAFRYATDWDLWIRLVLDGARIGCVAEPLARYRLQATGLSAQRPQLLRGRAAVLAKAAGHPGLDAAEQERVRRRAESQRAQAVLLEAHEGLAAGAPAARRLALAAAREAALPRSVRLRAALGALAPRLSGRLLQRKQRQVGIEGPAGVRFGAATAASAPTSQEAAPRSEPSR